MTYYVVEKKDGAWDVNPENGKDAASNISGKRAAIAAAKGFIGCKTGYIYVRPLAGFEEVIRVNC